MFLVGIGGLEGDGFRLRQFFLRSPVEEAAMLQALLPHLSQAAGLVSFNGATFDLPLLETRYRIAQRRGLGLDQQPHLDLLHPYAPTVASHTAGLQPGNAGTPDPWG